MVLAPFAKTKEARLPGRNPATPKSTVIRKFGKKEQRIHRPPLLNWKISRLISVTHKFFGGAEIKGFQPLQMI